jgi:IS5 family transposase
MSRLTFGDAEYAGKRKTTRREVFLAEMDQVVPWKSLLGLIEPFYPLACRGRQPYPRETRLRVHLMQNWFGLSDPGMEEALYEVASMRQFAWLNLLRAGRGAVCAGQPVPGAQTPDGRVGRSAPAVQEMR